MLDRWRLVLRYLPAYRRTVFAGMTALVVANFCLVATPDLMREGIRSIEQPTRAGDPVDVARVALFAAAAVGMALLGGAGGFFKRNLLMGVSRRIETDLRRDLFRHIQRLPLGHFDAVRTGDLMSRVTADVEAARMAIGPAAMYLADAVLRFGLVLALMLARNPVLTAWVVAPLAAICAGLVVLAPRIHRASRAVQDHLAAISARSQESFAGGRVVKAFATEEHEQRDLEELGQRYLAANVRLAHIRGAATAWVTLMGAVGLVTTIFVGGAQVVEGTFDIAGLLLFNSLQIMLTWPMIAIGWILSLVQRGAAGLDRIGEVFAVEPERSATTEAPPPQGAIEARALDFGYGATPVLRDVSFRLEAGRTLGIVGPTGCGKSTLVSLLPRLYDPPRGTLFLDGVDLLDLPLPLLRAAIAVVPQEAFLFSTSLRANIGFSHAEPPAGIVETAARDAHLATDLESFPRGIDTVVGERGVTLSGGQKQRAALARALAADAPVLVLDDALSAVDSGTEGAILGNLRRLGAHRTVIVVAHRVSAVRDADLILYLRDGRIVERGTHDALVAQGGEYARLARAQALEAEIEAMDP